LSDERWDVLFVTWPSPLFAEAVDLRYRTLHAPFGVPRDDCWNDEDRGSLHVMALYDGHVAGYARAILEPASGSFQIRQVAVDPAFERRGIGSAVVTALVEEGRRRGMHVWLNARETALPFYERLGFVVSSDTFRSPRTYLPHRRMDLPD
jgi:ribosomal protein S18 acetylase RimI-like enzyme